MNIDLFRRARYRELAYNVMLTSPALLLLATVVFIPMIWLSVLSFDGPAGFTLENYARLLHGSFLLSFKATFELAFLVTGLCALLGYPVAYLMAHTSGRRAALLTLCVLLPFWTSLLVRTYAWLIVLQRRGLINTWLTDLGIIDTPLRLVYNYTGTAIGMLHIMLPFMILPLYSVMKTINQDFTRAAAGLGATPSEAFRHIYLPLSLPGLLAGGVLVFVLSLGFYITPAILGGGRVMVWSMQIERNISLYANWGAASALGVVLIVVTLSIIWVATRILGIDRALER